MNNMVGKDIMNNDKKILKKNELKFVKKKIYF